MDVHSPEFAALSPEDQEIEIGRQLDALVKMLPKRPEPPKDPTDGNLGRLCDHFGALEARVRFFTRGAEDIANETGDGCILRASTDLLDHVAEFGELLRRAMVGKRVPNEGEPWEDDDA